MADKTLVLAHREELINQASLRISKINPHLVVDVDQGDRKASQSADVIVASIPTLGRMGSKRLEGYNPDAYKTIIVDEAHHATAESYRRTLNHFGAIDPNSHILLWGCTATPRRFDGTALDAVFQKIIFHRDLVEMMRSGYLCRVRVTTILTKTDASQVTSSKAAATNDRDFVISKLSEAIDTDERNNMIADAYVQKIQAERKSTLVFACDVKHIHNIVDSFRSRGVDADCVHGETPREERAAVLKRFLEGSLPVLVNCGVLSEGTDIPNIDCIIMARPTRSSLLFQQMVGRGLRTFPGKENCLVIDCVDDFKGKKVKLVTTPTLFGFPIPEGSVLSEADMLDLMDNMLKRKDLKKRAEELAERLAQDDIDDTGDDTSDDDLDLDGNANWYGPKLQHPAKNPVVGLVQYDLEELDPWHNEDEIIHRASSSTPVKTKHLFDSQFAWTAVTRGKKNFFFPVLKKTKIFFFFYHAGVDYVLSGMAKEKIDYRVVQEGGPNKFSLYQKQTFKDESTKIILHCEGESLQTAISTVEAKVGRQCKPHGNKTFLFFF